MPGSDINAGHVMPALSLDPEVVRQARELAAIAGQPIVEMARTHTTVSVERAVLRLGGLDARGKAFRQQDRVFTQHREPVVHPLGIGEVPPVGEEPRRDSQRQRMVRAGRF